MNNSGSRRLFSKDNANAKSNLVSTMERASQDGEAKISVLVGGQTKEFTIRRDPLPQMLGMPGKTSMPKKMDKPARMRIVDNTGKEVQLSGRRGGKSNSFIFNEGKFTWRTRFANVVRRQFSGGKENERGASKMDILKDLANHQVQEEQDKSPEKVGVPTGVTALRATNNEGSGMANKEVVNLEHLNELEEMQKRFGKRP
jgi:hypothetical protein